MLIALTWVGIKKKESNTSCVQHKAAGANHIYGLAPALSVYLLQDSVNVVPHRKFRQIEARGDLLIRQTLGNQ